MVCFCGRCAVLRWKQRCRFAAKQAFGSGTTTRRCGLEAKDTIQSHHDLNQHLQAATQSHCFMDVMTNLKDYWGK